MSSRRTQADASRLDGYGYAELVTMLGDPDRIQTVGAEPVRWRPGDGRPALASDDPAVVQAMGRCATHRVTATLPGGMSFRGRERSIHPAECAWCDFPLAELLVACDYAVHTSGFVTDEIATWVSRKDGREEVRSTGRGGTYANPAWAAFFSAPVAERRRRIAEASRP